MQNISDFPEFIKRLFKQTRQGLPQARLIAWWDNEKGRGFTIQPSDNTTDLIAYAVSDDLTSIIESWKFKDTDSPFNTKIIPVSNRPVYALNFGMMMHRAEDLMDELEYNHDSNFKTAKVCVNGMQAELQKMIKQKWFEA